MPIALTPAKTTVDSGAFVGFRARVTGGAHAAKITLRLTGSVGTPMPQERTVVLDGTGAGDADFQVQFAATSDTTAAIACADAGGTMSPAISTVTIIVPAAARMRMTRSMDIVQAVVIAEPAAKKPATKARAKAATKKPVAKKKRTAKKKPTAKKKAVAKKPAAKKKPTRRASKPSRSRKGSAR